MPVTLLTLSLLLLLPAVVLAQGWGEPPQARVQLGPFGITPRLTVEGGIDDNVFNDAVDRRSDFVTTSRAVVETTLGSGRARVIGSTQADYSYFRQYANQRGLGTSNRARLEFALHRVRPYVGGSFATARQRPSLEIDTRARRRELAFRGGMELRLSDRLSVDAAGERQKYAIADNEVFQGLDLGSALNRTTERADVALRYIYSPLTRFSLAVTGDRDRFDSRPGAVARSLRIAPTIEFSPLALVTGHAEVAFLKFRPVVSDIESFNGIVTSVELNYVLLGRTRFTGRTSREPSYSAQAASVYYVQTGIGGSIATLITEQLDVRASWDRNHLSYRQIRSDDASVPFTNGTGSFIYSFGGSIGYRLGRNTRLALNADFNRRIAAPLQRDFESFKFYSAITYGS